MINWLKDNGKNLKLYLLKWLDCVISAFWKPTYVTPAN